MDVATLVKNITSAFEDASTLVNRIRKKKEGESDTNVAPIDDLLDSLSLGPTVVRGYYESDARRFGNAYTTGDATAREQLKDALINLQMTVLTGLRTHMDEKDPDYDAIQSASDDCRVNVGVCLGQLSQRMSKAAKGLGSPGKMHIYDNIPAKSVDRSSSHSTQSSGQTKLIPMTPPESDTEFLGEQGTTNAQYRKKFAARAPDLDAMDSMHATSYAGLYSSPQDNSVNVPLMYRSSIGGSIPIPRGLDSPVSPNEFNNLDPQHARYSSVSSGTSSVRQQSLYPSQPNQDGQGQYGLPGDTSSWGYFLSQQYNEQSKSPPYGDLPSATLGRTQTPTSIPIHRKPSSSSHNGGMVSSPNSMHPLHRPSIPEEEEKEVYFSPPVPTRSLSRGGFYPRPPSFHASEGFQRPDSGHWNNNYPSMGTLQPGDVLQYNNLVSPPGTLQPGELLQYNNIISPPGTLQQNEIQQYASAMQQNNTLQRNESLPFGTTGHHLSVSSQRTDSLPYNTTTPHSSISVQRNPSIQRTNSRSLTLPTEKDLQGYCKGAFRLQIGLEKKAFVLANRPVGLASMIQYWRCDKCFFEGQYASITPPGAKKPEKVFDPSIRDASGIRYKWAFLAKCHVPMKSMPNKGDGSHGSFLCIFCVAESSQRGWTFNSSNTTAPHPSNDTASIKSSNSGSNSGAGAPPTVYGNVAMFMEHLQIHRQQEYWPGIEMQGRMKCIVGKVAMRGDDFDINLLPIIPVPADQL